MACRRANVLLKPGRGTEYPAEEGRHAASSTSISLRLLNPVKAEHGTIDTIDLKILTLLQRDGRITNARLAEEVALSPSSCLQRVRKLERDGTIARYRADLDVKKLFPAVSVAVSVKMRSDEPVDTDAFLAAVAAMPEVVECREVSGDVDYLMRIVCRDMDAYHRLTGELQARAPGILKLTSHVVLRDVKVDRGYPLEALA